MADLLDKLHVDAGLNLLRADAGLVVYPDVEGNTPLTPTPPYVRVYPVIESPIDSPNNAVDGRSANWVTRWYCHCVGANEYAAVAVSMRVRAALLDKAVTIAGRSCGLIRREAAIPPQRDDTTGHPIFDAVAVYALATTG